MPNPINFSIELVNRCKAGNRSSQFQLYKLMAPAMFAICIKHAPTVNDAERILTNGFIVIFNNIRQFDHTISLHAWCKQVILQSIDEYLLILDICSIENVGSKVFM